MELCGVASQRWPWQAPAMACSTAAVCRTPAVHGDVWKRSRIGWNGSSFHIWKDSRVSRGSSSRVAALGGGAMSEEERWQREEARWLREEARWLREEARWEEERKAWAQESQAMAEEVRVLKREIEQLRVETMESRRPSPNGASLSALMSGLKQVLQSLPPSAESKSTAFAHELPLVSETPAVTFESSGNSDAFSDIGSSIPSMSEFSIDLVSEASSSSSSAAAAAQGSRPGTVSSSHPKARKLLKKGADGDEVKRLQDALAALGFYSGEEEMEFAMFSNETESAVKAWQASIGALEDGILSTDLLDYLFGRSSRPSAPTENPKTSPQAAKPDPPPAAERSEQRKTFAEDKRDVEGTMEKDIAPNRRVFLLGENRWEEPGRLFAKPSNNGTPSGPRPVLAEKCFSCRGEGVTMCTECEGTGELNVEDQFLEWVEEGSKCPYCEGSGAVPCDVCAGIGAISTM